MASTELEYVREQYLHLEEKLREYEGCKSTRKELEAVLSINTTKSDELEIERMAASQKADNSSNRLRQEKSYILKKFFAPGSYNDVVKKCALEKQS